MNKIFINNLHKIISNTVTSCDNFFFFNNFIFIQQTKIVIYLIRKNSQNMLIKLKEL